MNLILNEVLNNEEELLHIESLITFKDLIKKYYQNKSLNITSNIQKDSVEENIDKNIIKIFEKCEGLIFNSETVKNSYDAKDILVIVTEYNTEFRLKALQISIKLISQFLNDNKNYYLKNSNTIVFYSLKNFILEKVEKAAIEFENQFRLNENENQVICNDYSNLTDDEKETRSNINILIYLKANNQIFKNLFYSLLKRNLINSNVEELIFISELISNFIIKTETLIFSEAEIKSIFDFIFNLWKSSDEESENNLSTCIVALTSKFNFLENYKTINLFFQTKIDYLLKILRNKSEEINTNENTNTDSFDNLNISKYKLDKNEINYKEINKYLNLFIKFFTVEKISTYVLKEYLSIYIKMKKNLILFYRKLNKKLFHESQNNFDGRYDNTLNYSEFPNVQKSNIESDILMKNSQADFQNLQIIEEEKIYNLIILILKNISENILKIINENIQILNLKTENTDLKTKNSGCCQGKKSQSKKSGCCQGRQATKTGCCGGNEHEEYSSSEDDKLKEINNNSQDQSQQKCKNKDINEKNKKEKTPEEIYSEIILKNNSLILFEAIKQLIYIDFENNNNFHDVQQMENKINKSELILGNYRILDISLEFYFEIYDSEIFKSSLTIIQNYLKSDFTNKQNNNELSDLIIKILMKLNKQLNENNREEVSKVLKYYLIIFDSKTDGIQNNSICDNKENQNYFFKIQKFFYLKYLLKIIKSSLNVRYDNEESFELTINKKTKKVTEKIISSIKENVDRDIGISQEIKKLSFTINSFISCEVSNIYFEKLNKNKEKDYLSFIYMLSLDNDLLTKFSDDSASSLNDPQEKQNKNKRIPMQNFSESEKQNQLIFSFKYFQQGKLPLEDLKVTNFNFYQLLIFFTKLNKTIHKLTGFYYFSLYTSLKNLTKLQGEVLRYCEDKMDIEEPIYNKNYKGVIQEHLKITYDDFLFCFEKIIGINKHFNKLILNTLEESEKEKYLNFNVFESIDCINRLNCFINHISLVNDKNVFEILSKISEKFFAIFNNILDLEVYLKKEIFENKKNLENKNILEFTYLYFSLSLFVKIINGNISFNTINNPYISINSELLRNKIKINFLKFNKKIYETHFDKNLIYEYLQLFKKNTEVEFIQIENNFDSNFISEEINKLAKTNMLSIFDVYKKALINSIFFLDNNFYKSIVTKFNLNFYLNFDFETLQENIDIILDNTLKSLSEGICLEKAAKSLKNIIQYIGRNFLQRKGYNMNNIIENLVKVIIIFSLFIYGLYLINL